VSCGVDHRSGSDTALLWLWCRLTATAPIRPLAWEPPPYAAGAALEKAKRQKKKKRRYQRIVVNSLGCVITLLIRDQEHILILARCVLELQMILFQMI